MLRHFQNFKKYAFRLELLSEYNVPDEREHFLEFLKTRTYDPNINSEWRKLIREAIKRGAKMSRVHVVDTPLGDYLQFELICYKVNEQAGERIFLLDRTYFEKIKSDIDYDFWLFDDKIVLKMKYDKEGHFIGFQEINKDIQKYVDLKDKLLNVSKDYKLWQKK